MRRAAARPRRSCRRDTAPATAPPRCRRARRRSSTRSRRDGAGADAASPRSTPMSPGASSSDGPNGPEIEADLEVPERGMKIKFSLHKNADETLPGEPSRRGGGRHAGRFPRQGRSGSIPRIVLKPTEDGPRPAAGRRGGQGRRRLLLDRAVGGRRPTSPTNLALIRERGLDRPALRLRDRPARHPHLREGRPGDRAFEQALAAWTTPG